MTNEVKAKIKKYERWVNDPFPLLLSEVKNVIRIDLYNVMVSGGISKLEFDEALEKLEIE